MHTVVSIQRARGKSSNFPSDGNFLTEGMLKAEISVPLSTRKGTCLFLTFAIIVDSQGPYLVKFSLSYLFKPDRVKLI